MPTAAGSRSCDSRTGEQVAEPVAHVVGHVALADPFPPGALARAERPVMVEAGGRRGSPSASLRPAPSARRCRPTPCAPRAAGRARGRLCGRHASRRGRGRESCRSGATPLLVLLVAGAAGDTEVIVAANARISRSKKSGRTRRPRRASRRRRLGRRAPRPPGTPRRSAAANAGREFGTVIGRERNARSRARPPATRRRAVVDDQPLRGAGATAAMLSANRRRFAASFRAGVTAE